MKKQIHKHLLSWSGSIILPYIVVFLALYGVMLNQSFIMINFERMVHILNFKKNMSTPVTQILALYRSGTPATTNFSMKRKSHLNDVRGLYQKAKAWWLGSLLAVVLICDVLQDKKMILAMINVASG